MTYASNTLFASGRARLQASNPIAVQYDHLLMVAVFDKDTGEILELEMNTICDLTSNFLKRLIVGKSLYKDQELICSLIEERYHGASQKAFCSCVKDMVSKATNRIKD